MPPATIAILWHALRSVKYIIPGRLLALSTPAGKHPDNFFSRTWRDPEFDGHKVKVTADECPRLSKEFLAKELRRLGEVKYREEYFCEFMDPEGAAFPMDLISGCLSHDVEYWHLGC